MTSLTAILTEISVAKRKYDQAAVQIEANARAQKQAAKQEIFALIKRATDDGARLSAVSGKGMGYANISGLQGFVGARRATVESILEAVGTDVGELKRVMAVADYFFDPFDRGWSVTGPGIPGGSPTRIFKVYGSDTEVTNNHLLNLVGQDGFDLDKAMADFAAYTDNKYTATAL